MSDLVVTVPKDLWAEWIAEGDAVGEPESGAEWGFFLGGARPDIRSRERLYIVAWGLVRGYAPATEVKRIGTQWVICRRAGAVAVTIDEQVQGFRGWRRRWWRPEHERPFPNWKTAGLPARMLRDVEQLGMSRAVAVGG